MFSDQFVITADELSRINSLLVEELAVINQICIR